MEVDNRPEEKFKQRFTEACATAQSMKTRNWCPTDALRRVGWFLTWGEDRGGLVVWATGVTYVVCPPSCRCHVPRSCTVPCFAPSSSEMAVGLWCFYVLLFEIAFARVQLYLVPYGFFVAQRDICLGANPPIKGPGSQPVSSPFACCSLSLDCVRL